MAVAMLQVLRSTIIHLIIFIYYDTEHEFINAHR